MRRVSTSGLILIGDVDEAEMRYQRLFPAAAQDKRGNIFRTTKENPAAGKYFEQPHTCLLPLLSPPLSPPLPLPLPFPLPPRPRFPEPKTRKHLSVNAERPGLKSL